MKFAKISKEQSLSIRWSCGKSNCCYDIDSIEIVKAINGKAVAGKGEP